MAAYFTIDAAGWFVGSTLARGPWSPEACHAGPPAGLIARAAERLHPDLCLVRLTLDLDRPIPTAGFKIEGETATSGRSVCATTLRLTDRNGKVCVRAAGLHLIASPLPHDLPSVSPATPRLGEAIAGSFPIRRPGAPLEGFSASTEMRYPPGHDPSPGPTIAWMKTVPLLEGEKPSPFQRICPLADSGNAISRNAGPDAASFLNPDLTIILHRRPEGDWLGSDAYSTWQPNGIGLADALLFDAVGAVGRACQTLLVQPTTTSDEGA